MTGPSPGAAPPGPAGDGPRSARPGVPLRAALLASLAVIVAAAGVLAYVAARPAQPRAAGLLRPSGIPAGISTGLADLMALSPVPAARAPDFTLTDQTGRTLSLSDLRGRVVVLEFMDPHCADICPIVSDEFVGAYHDLGPAAAKVVFAAVNVNPYHAAVADVAAFSHEQQLTTIPGWHFLTGPVPVLRAVWRAYGVVVDTRGPGADVIHSSDVYFIDPRGIERYLAAPMADHTASGTAYLPQGTMAEWGRGIALVARELAH